jgi:hypothetical protein
MGEGPHRDSEKDSERQVADLAHLSFRVDDVPDADAAKEAVARAAATCDGDWQRLYRFG